MTRSRLNTDYRIWAAATACLFVGLGFVDPVAGVAKGDNSWWAHVTRSMFGNYLGDTSEVVIPIVVQAAPLAFAAALIGWVVQALVVVLRARFSPEGAAQR